MCQLSIPLEVVRLRGMAQFDQDEISKSQKNGIRRLIEPIHLVRLKFYLLQMSNAQYMQLIHAQRQVHTPLPVAPEQSVSSEICQTVLQLQKKKTCSVIIHG